MNITLSITLIEGSIRHVVTLANEFMLLESKDIYESLGFGFEDTEDGLYHKVILPEEWQFNSIHNINHRYYNIIDMKSRCRATLACEPTYDSFTFYLSTRYCLHDRYIDAEKKELGVFAVDSLDDKELYYAGSYKHIGKERHMFERLTRKAQNYLSEHFPDWRNPTKYWD